MVKKSNKTKDKTNKRKDNGENKPDRRPENWKRKHGKLLEDPQVREWHKKIARRSLLSADVRLRTLGHYCELMNTTPSEILEHAQTGELKPLFKKFIEKMEDQKKSGSYLQKYKVVLNNWLNFNEVNYKITEAIFDSDKNRKYYGEKIPTQTELIDLIRHASLRGRVCISLMAFSGLRPESIGNYQGNDGIRLGDIEGFDPEKLKFNTIPAVLNVRENLSKNNKPYFTFLGNEAIKYITEYLKDRQNHVNEKGKMKGKKEILTKESPLVNFGYGSNNVRDHVRTMIVGKDIREAMRRSGLKQRPYVLRRYFITQLSIAEGRGWVTHEWRLLISGHTGDIQNLYVFGKGNLDPETLKSIREAYGKCLTLLETSKGEYADQSTWIRKTILSAIYTKEEISKMDISGMSDNDFNEMIRKKFNADMLNNGQRQKIVPESEIEEWISKGYEFQSVLPSGKCILKLPTN